MRNGSVLVVLALAAVAGYACSKRSSEPTGSAPAAASNEAPSAAHAPAVEPELPKTPSAPHVADISWDVPSGWQTVANPSTMRKATYKIAKAAGDADDAEMSVTQVGGGVQANLLRWTGQFTERKDAPKKEQRIVGSLKITTLEVHGAWAGGGMPGTPAEQPRKGYALLGAIVESTDPPYFFKMTGPEKTVMAARASFDKLVESMKAK